MNEKHIKIMLGNRNRAT